MSTNYTPGIPNPPNSPSADVPIMQSNANSINNIWMPDHITFNNTAAGLHKQVTFALNQSAPGFTNGVSDLFVNSTTGISGTGSSLFFQNALGTFQLTNLAPITGSDSQGGGYSLFKLACGLNLFTGSTASFVGSQTFTMVGATFGGTIYTAGGSVFGTTDPDVFLRNFSPAGGASTFVAVVQDNSASIRWFVLTN